MPRNQLQHQKGYILLLLKSYYEESCQITSPIIFATNQYLGFLHILKTSKRKMYNQGQSVYSYPVIGPGTRYNQEILNDFIIIIQIMKLLFATHFVPQPAGMNRRKQLQSHLQHKLIEHTSHH